MLSPADDFLLHQTPDTFDRVFTSDRNFYDRYYFNLHSSSDELFLVFGMGQYPNLGTTDAFVTVSHGTNQYTVRASRELGANRLDTTVGPFGVEVIEGLRRFHIWCEPNEWDLDLDLTWEGAVPTMEEPPFFQRSFSRIVTQGSRMTQSGFWSGKLRVAGQEYTVTPDKWMGIRDHSWGIRPIGEPEHPGIRSKLAASEGFFWNWVPMQFKDFTIHYIAGENADGERTGGSAGTAEEAKKIYAYGIDREQEHLGTPRHNMRFHSGSREMKTATVTFEQPGREDIVVECTALRNLHLGAGTGYGGEENWRHGMYQGDLVVQGIKYDLADPKVVASVGGGFGGETLTKFELNGETGYGMYEHALRGIYRPYGFNTPTDVAP